MMTIPRFKKIQLNKDTKYTYTMIPLSKVDLGRLKEKYATEKDGFLIDIKSHVIDSDHIIMFGNSDENPQKVESKIEPIIVSRGGALTVPSIIDTKNNLMSDTITTGVPAFRVYKYNVALLGNPANIIIFKDYIINKNKPYGK